ncbi:hypothetical protein RHSIM_Rhsim02G0047900 [Rhododendron simsii]|uniref:Uncharacterized protein n=1 Tax=Rhododendron simsii TaxID=118357 RepID=A0A834HDJ5_RHOSS|nr:hypothetical protein RHSIM_Rhsim02G0047900 [Rhododendron simsii]
MGTVGRTVAAPLLFLNFVMYFIVLGFASLGGNPATGYFLTFAILAAVLGIVSKFAGGTHIRAWRNDSLAAAGATALVAWAVTVLAFGFACKEITLKGHRGWRLKVLEAFIIILTLTELLYLLLIHAGMISSRHGPGYRDTGYGTDPAGHAGHKGTGIPESRV